MKVIISFRGKCRVRRIGPADKYEADKRAYVGRMERLQEELRRSRGLGFITAVMKDCAAGAIRSYQTDQPFSPEIYARRIAESYSPKRADLWKVLSEYRIERGSGATERLRSEDIKGIADAIIKATDQENGL